MIDHICIILTEFKLTLFENAVFWNADYYKSTTAS